MASRAFFDPIIALRALPLVSSTCSLFFGWDQTFFLQILNRPEIREVSKRMIPAYFRSMIKIGIPIVVSLLGVSFWSGLGNLLVGGTLLQHRGSFRWYALGSALALSHLLYVPWVAVPIQDIVEEKEGTDANDRLAYWIRINNTRTLTVDLAAWGAFVMAVGKTLQ